MTLSLLTAFNVYYPEIPTYQGDTHMNTCIVYYGRLSILVFVLLCMAPGLVAQTGFFDDFESCQAGAFPCGWTYSGNSNIVIDSSVASTGKQSTRLFGLLSACWAALLHRPLHVSPPFTVEFYTRNGTEPLSGCHPYRASVAIYTQATWTSPGRSLITFLPDGGIQTGGVASAIVGTYNSNQWVKVRIGYQRPSSSLVTVSYWINDIFKGTFSDSATTDESSLAYLSLVSQEGTAWFDDVRVTPCCLSLLSCQNGPWQMMSLAIFRSL